MGPGFMLCKSNSQNLNSYTMKIALPNDNIYDIV